MSRRKQTEIVLKLSQILSESRIKRRSHDIVTHRSTERAFSLRHYFPFHYRRRHLCPFRTVRDYGGLESLKFKSPTAGTLVALVVPGGGSTSFR